MIALLEQHRVLIEELCRKYAVARLDVFGSAATGTFDSQRSDIDFLVEFLPMSAQELSRCYFGMLLDLEKLLNYRVDLVMVRAIRNPYFRQAAQQGRQPLYAA